MNRPVLIWLLVALGILTEGYGISVGTYTARALATDWSLDRTTVGTAFTAALVGMIIGGPLFGAVADRHGRRLALVATVAIVAAGLVATAYASGMRSMIACRFLTGIGLGGLLPAAAVMVFENADRQWRAIAVAGLFAAVAIGSNASNWIAERHEADWRAAFSTGGWTAAAIAVLLLITLRDGATTPVASPRSGLGSEMARRKGAFTALGLALLCGQVAVYGFTLSLSALLKSAGVSAERSETVMSIYHLTGLVGGLFAAWLIGRGVRYAAALLPAIGAVLMACAMLFGSDPNILGIIGSLAGFAVAGNLIALTAATPFPFDRAWRVTAAGCVLSFSRLGSIAGAAYGSTLGSTALLGICALTLALGALCAATLPIRNDLAP